MPAPGPLVRRYRELHRSCAIEGNEALPVDVGRLLDRGLDLEALELALRARERDNTLTRKLQALCTLAEVRGAYFGRFVQRRDARLAPFAALLWLGVRSLYKRAKGHWLLRGLHEL